MLPVHAIHNYNLCTTVPSLTDFCTKNINMCTKCCISIQFTTINIHSYITISKALLDRNVLDLSLYWVSHTEQERVPNWKFQFGKYMLTRETQFTKREQKQFVTMQRAPNLRLCNAGMPTDYDNTIKPNLQFLHLCYTTISCTILSPFILFSYLRQYFKFCTYKYDTRTVALITTYQLPAWFHWN